MMQSILPMIHPIAVVNSYIASYDRILNLTRLTGDNLVASWISEMKHGRGRGVKAIPDKVPQPGSLVAKRKMRRDTKRMDTALRYNSQ
jgi:hypothetical protein